jgi:hypothetical protein
VWRPVKEYELYVPLSYNDGTPVDPKILMQLRERLLTEFGGLTFFPQPNEGFWTFGGVTYRDEIVVYRVLSEHVRTARRFFRELKEELKRKLKQEEILIVEKDADLL